MPDSAAQPSRLDRLHQWCDRAGMDRGDPFRAALAEAIEAAQEAKDAAREAKEAASRPAVVLSPEAERALVERIAVAAPSAAERRAGELAQAAMRKDRPRTLAWQAGFLLAAGAVSFLLGQMDERGQIAAMGARIAAAMQDRATAEAIDLLLRANPGTLPQSLEACGSAAQTWRQDGRRACAVPAFLDPPIAAPTRSQ